MGKTVHVYGVEDADGTYRLLAEETRASLAGVSKMASDMLDQIDVFGVPARRERALASCQVRHPGGGVAAVVTPVYEVDLSGDVPEDLVDVVRIDLGTRYPRQGSCDGKRAASAAEALEALRFMPDGCASMPSFKAGSVLWTLSCERSGRDTQHAELVSEHGLAIDLGENGLFFEPNLSWTHMLDEVSPSLSVSGGKRGVVCGTDMLEELSCHEVSIESAAMVPRAEWGLAPQVGRIDEPVTPETVSRLAQMSDEGLVYPEVGTVMAVPGVPEAILSEEEGRELLEAGEAMALARSEGIDGAFPGAREACGWRTPHLSQVVVDDGYMRDHGILQSGVRQPPEQGGRVDMSWNGTQLELSVERYPANPKTLAVRAADASDGHQVGVVTVNLGERLRMDEAYVDEASMPGVSRALAEAGIARDTGQRGSMEGIPGTFPLMRFDAVRLRAIDPEGYAAYEGAYGGAGLDGTGQGSQGRADRAACLE